MTFAASGMTIRGVLRAVGFVLVAHLPAHAAEPPRGFVDVKTVIPDLVVEMRYTTDRNFVGRVIPGYKASRCLLTRPAVKGLQCVADDLRPRGFVLKVYDCYRPQRAVDAFVAWGHNLRDQKMKSQFYPEVDKRNLFSSNYIASRSGHSRGSTLDLTIAPVAAKDTPFDPSAADVRACDSKAGTRTDDGSADMGTGFDCFSTLSHTLTTKVSDKQRENRALLRNAMRGCGFYNNPSEWWHYTFRGEPYPGTYFDFPVE